MVKSWLPEVIDNAGLLAIPGNYQELATKLKSLILDDGLREKQVKRGLKRVKQKFDRIIQAEKIVKIYRNL